MTPRFSPCLRAPACCLGLLLLSGMAARAAEEPPATPPCHAALAALAEAEDALAAIAAASAATTAAADRQQAVAARLFPLRQRVANACLGGLTRSPPPSQQGSLVPPSPGRPAVPAVRMPSPTPPVTVPLPRVDAPVTVSNCNAATCLASDGSTLTRVGLNLVGPRGLCTVQGAFLRCP